MYYMVDKMIPGCKFEFSNFRILTLQIPIACFDMIGKCAADETCWLMVYYWVRRLATNFYK